jgi:hypothetical protein
VYTLVGGGAGTDNIRRREISLKPSFAFAKEKLCNMTATNMEIVAKLLIIGLFGFNFS